MPETPKKFDFTFVPQVLYPKPPKRNNTEKYQDFIKRLYFIRIYFKKIIDILTRGNNLILETIKLKENWKWRVVMELGCWPWFSFNELVKYYWYEVEKIIMLEANSESIKKHEELLKNKKYNKVRDKIEFYNIDVRNLTEKTLINMWINLKSINLIIGKAFIHHLSNEEQLKLFKELKPFLKQDWLLFFYNQFCEQELFDWTENNTLSVIIFNIVVKIIIEKLWINKEDLKNLNIKNKEVEIYEKLKKYFSYIWMGKLLLEGFIYKIFISFSPSFKNKLLKDTTDLLLKEWCNNINEMIEHLIYIYAFLFSQNISNPENLIYNIQTPEELIKIMKEAWLKETGIIKNKDWYWTSWVFGINRY